jgi:nucleotide-binding universal stress UspA family protein
MIFKRSHMYQRILVPYDGSPTSARGLDEAIQLAKLTQGKLRILHVIDEMSIGSSMAASGGYVGGFDFIGVMRDGAKELLQKAKQTAEDAGIPAETALHDTYDGRLNALVAAEAHEWKAELIVLGSHGRRGLSRAFLGSGAESILRSAPVPVLLIRAPEKAEVA